MDHSTPTDTAQIFGGLPIKLESAARQVRQLEVNCAEFGVNLIGLQDSRRGIVHIIGPGATQPGKTIVCGDSHTSTHGAFGALAFGIGTTEVGYVLATQCLLQRKPKTFEIVVSGRLPAGVSAKDVVLAVIGRIGVNGGTGHVIEFRGSTIEAMSMDERMTVCNMFIEAGARAGMIAPDATTCEYLKGRPFAPQGADWDRAVADWDTLRSDVGATFDKSVTFDAGTLERRSRSAPTRAWSPRSAATCRTPWRCRICEVAGVYGADGGRAPGREAGAGRLHRQLHQRAHLGPGSRRRRPARTQGCRGVRALVVPGSQQIKLEAERRGLAKVFIDAGAEWRESGCSMC